MNHLITYDAYEISGCCEVRHGAYTAVEQCEDCDAQFWTLFGHIKGEGVEAIGDFDSREHAEEVYYRITGKSYHEEATGTRTA